MTATNDVTGDSIQTKIPNKNYLDNFGKAFTKTYKVTYLVGSSSLEYEAFVEASSYIEAKRHFNNFARQTYIEQTTLINVSIWGNQ